jgi:CheY-like chemotaxis protein
VKKLMNTTNGSQTFHILLVDDSDADIYFLRLALKRSGVECELTVINDGAEALAFANKQGKYSGSPQLNLAVIDLNLPKYGGIEILTAMRQNKEFQSVPVVIMTSSAMPGEQVVIEDLGVEHLIAKPPDLEGFLQIGEVLRAVLLKRRACP